MSRNATFHRRLQKSLTLVAAIGQCMSGFAGTPADRQAHESKWNVPKCRAKMSPIIPTQPTKYGRSAGRSGVIAYNTATPKAAFANANSHSPGVGGSL